MLFKADKRKNDFTKCFSRFTVFVLGLLLLNKYIFALDKRRRFIRTWTYHFKFQTYTLDFRPVNCVTMNARDKG